MNRIHPTAVIDSTVTLGDGNVVGPYAVILGDTQLGNDNWIGPHAVIGAPAQMRGLHPETEGAKSAVGRIVIGSHNVIREFVTIHSSTTGLTAVGDACYFMTQSHVPHDARFEDRVTLSNSVHIGGHSIVQRDSIIGLGAVIHQRTVVGARAMIGMGTVVTRDVPPFSMFFGSPGRLRGGNTIGMDLDGIDPQLASSIDDSLTTGDFERLRVLVPKEFARFIEAGGQLPT